MSSRKSEAESTTTTLISYTNVSWVEIGDLQPDSLAITPERENREVVDEDIAFQNLENELAPGTLAILAIIETFDEYFHCCGRW